MMPNHDVIIVGSGPAGVSCAFPLVQAGLRVLMVDGGHHLEQAPPAQPYLQGRRQDARQWEWMLGRDFHALRNEAAVSPKLRVPALAPVFADFHRVNRVTAPGFVTVGSLASGGLSNAWGCGVARLSPQEQARMPLEPGELDASYQTVAQRIGISGAAADDLTDYFNLDAWAGVPVALDPLQSRLAVAYRQRRAALQAAGLRMGRARIAVLSEDRDARQACNLSGNCLWGCARRSLYSAQEDLGLLKAWPNFTYRSGFVVEQVRSEGGRPFVQGHERRESESLQAATVVLAAGTLATSRLVLEALRLEGPLPLQSSPTAAFMLWLPRALGMAPAPAFALGQLSYALTLAPDATAFGSLFSTSGIPVAEFIRHLPLGKRQGIGLLQQLLGSCVLGNLFLPGHLARASLRLDKQDTLQVEGAWEREAYTLLQMAERRLRRHLLGMGALLLPGSFKAGQPGSDIHYAASLPMQLQAQPGECWPSGELCGLAGIHVADAASLPFLTEKSHTLTIMANADRIGRHLARKLSAGPN